jgi:hypothetical protein
METMFSNTWAKVKKVKAFSVAAYNNTSPGQKVALQAAVAMAIVMMPEIAFAQTAGQTSGTNFFCFIAQYFKGICGTAALVAICMWAIEHIFGAAKLHDMVVKVGIAAAIVIGGSTIITNSGLTSTCAL